ALTDRGGARLRPVHARVLARVQGADAPPACGVVRRAGAAVDGWAATAVNARTALLRRVADRIADRFEEFVQAESADTGKPNQQARELDVARAVANFRSFADTVAAAGQPSFLTDLASGRQALNYAVPKP